MPFASDQVAASCTKCRSRKVKCSGVHPCEACSRRGDICVFKYKLKTGLKKGSGRVLERRVAELESQLSHYTSRSTLTDAQTSSIVQLYFESIHTQHPFLLVSSPPSAVTLHAIVASTLTLIKHDKSAPSLVDADCSIDDIIDERTRSVLQLAHGALDMDTIQALTLLSWCGLRDAHSPSKWLYLMTLSQSVNVVFNDSESPFMQRTPLNVNTKSESSIRLYWSAFIIDRLAAFTSGWSPGITRFNIPLPSPDSDDNEFRHIVELFLVNDSMHTLYSAPVDLTSLVGVQAWRDAHATLAVEIDGVVGSQRECAHSHAKPNTPTVVLLQEATQLRHHSLVAYPPHTTAAFTSDDVCRVRCTDAARSIAHTASDVCGLVTASNTYDAHLKGVTSSPLVIWSVWIAARNHLLASAHNAHPNHALPIDYFQLAQSLRVLEPSSRLANVYANMLDKITTSDQTTSILATARTSFTVLKDASDAGYNNTLTSDLDVLFQDIFSTFV